MAPDAPRPRMQQMTSTGTTLAVTLAPLVIGVLLARTTLAMDPLTPVNALITRTGHGTGVSPAEWRGCGRSALRRCRTWKPLARHGVRRTVGAGRAPAQPSR
ncbi:hypothetical protein ACIBI8_16445 [Streptomyces sp. NPDC050529]|uniref:hypothetical protein n=1 Tax=unclassified Streptomyces TaxID=2593676 RepID=UPI002DD9DAC7|nr:hypothetical protein [Streptomyces sp. NBC_01022]MEE4496443.1 hypothetical protein [Streptomyces sp. BE230]WRZ86038.1 hypothetical protein OG316_40055 [Streptomyces sp. NBC_01022]